MRPIVVTVGPLVGANAANIVASTTTPAVGTVLTLTAGAIAKTTPDVPRRVLVTSTGNDSNTVITIAGTDWNGNTISEAVTGINTTAYTKYDFATVTSATITSASGANTVGNITIGTNGVASSMPVMIDNYTFAPTSIQVAASGTVSYTVQQTLDDVNKVGYVATTWVNHPDANFVANTATAQGNYAYIPQFCRVTLNSGSGTITMTVIQAASPT